MFIFSTSYLNVFRHYRYYPDKIEKIQKYTENRDNALYNKRYMLEKVCIGRRVGGCAILQMLP